MSNYTNVPRSEYPRPQFIRSEWMTLNGEWEFAHDYSVSGLERGLCDGRELPERITVPFCRESVLSGIGNTDFCNCVWYRRAFTLPENWDTGRILLHIGACDYETTVFVNGKKVTVHRGGYTPIECDISDYLVDGENVITVRAFDDVRSHDQSAGKQSARYGSYGCFYTRTTGIWQSVWLERVPESYIKSVRYYTDINDSKLTLVATVAGDSRELVLRAEAFYEDRAVGCAAVSVSGSVCTLEMKLDELHLWEIGNGRLYDLHLTLGDDTVKSYFGMRSVHARNGALYLNGKPVFQRLVLDQGFYPDGIYTASTQAELFADVERSLAMGFNGARLHQKIFEPEFLSECDRRGYIVWGEHGNWGLNVARPAGYASFLPEWTEAVERDFNHPAIIGWCPLNETQPDQDDYYVRSVVNLTKTLDPTRPCIDTSGWYHVDHISDILDLHNYTQDVEAFRALLEPLERNENIELGRKQRSCPGVATFVSEYGGIGWSVDGNGWGYGDAPKTEEEFIERLFGLTKVICDNKKLYGFCYTQLTDVEQEVNGLYTYDRHPKFDPAIIKKAFTQSAVMEIDEE